MCKRLHVKYSLFFSDCNKTWIFSTDFRGKKLKYQVSSKSVQWKLRCSMRTDGRIDMTKLTVAFLKNANAPKESKTACHENCVKTFLVSQDCYISCSRNVRRCELCGSEGTRRAADNPEESRVTPENVLSRNESPASRDLMSPLMEHTLSLKERRDFDG
jgi:hypothetical protein